ncbi:hypothetical protein ACWF82_02755 [Nocardia sp. NPDC055053]
MTESRADRFARDLRELEIPDPSAGRSGLWLRTGAVLLVAGPVLVVLAYLMSHGTTDPLTQRDAIVLALGGVAAAVSGGAVFLRYSLTNFLRFWLARQAFELDGLAERAIREPMPSGPAD